MHSTPNPSPLYTTPVGTVYPTSALTPLGLDKLTVVQLVQLANAAMQLAVQVVDSDATGAIAAHGTHGTAARRYGAMAQAMADADSATLNACLAMPVPQGGYTGGTMEDPMGTMATLAAAWCAQRQAALGNVPCAPTCGSGPMAGGCAQCGAQGHDEVPGTCAAPRYDCTCNCCTALPASATNVAEMARQCGQVLNDNGCVAVAGVAVGAHNLLAAGRYSQYMVAGPGKYENGGRLAWLLDTLTCGMWYGCEDDIWGDNDGIRVLRYGKRLLWLDTDGSVSVERLCNVAAAKAAMAMLHCTSAMYDGADDDNGFGL